MNVLAGLLIGIIFLVIFGGIFLVLGLFIISLFFIEEIMTKYGYKNQWELLEPPIMALGFVLGLILLFMALKKF